MTELCSAASDILLPGSIVSGLYLSTRPHTPIKFFVNVSGRYDHSRFLENKNYLAGFAKDGHYDWTAKVAGKTVTHRVLPKGVRTRFVAPAATDALTRTDGCRSEISPSGTTLTSSLLSRKRWMC